MENNDNNFGTTPLPNDSLNELSKSNLDDFNPYRDDAIGGPEEKNEKDTNNENKDNKEEEKPMEKLFEVDPDKGNISEQLGLQFDFPSQNHINNSEEQPSHFNEPKNMQITDNVPQPMEGFDFNKNENNTTQNNNNNNNYNNNFNDNNNNNYNNNFNDNNNNNYNNK